MNTALNKYHPSSLHSGKTSLQSFLFPWCAWGQSNTWCGGAEWIYLRNTTCYFFFFFLCREVRLPKVSFFWASLMEREIIMSWPVNNCMPQWDIRQYDMLYVLHPLRSLTKQRGAFAFLPLPDIVICYLLQADKHTRKRMQRSKKKKKKKKKEAVKSNSAILLYVLKNWALRPFLIYFSPPLSQTV